MKTVLISIKEKWWKKILSGEKELEIRKNRPKGIEYPFRVVCYVTGRGIMGAFTCDYIKKTNDYKELSERSGLEPGELFEYANGANGKTDTCLYGWHVKEGTPVEFDQAFKIDTAGVVRPPQSWCYIQEYTANLVAYSFDGETYGATYNNTKEALKDAIVEFEEFKKHPLKRGIPNKIFVGQCEFYRPSLSNSGYDAIEAFSARPRTRAASGPTITWTTPQKNRSKNWKTALKLSSRIGSRNIIFTRIFTRSRPRMSTLTTANSLSRKGTRNESPSYNGRRRGITCVYLRTGRGRVV